ncbi:MAG: hypothetical protein JO340_20710 [Acidobacteriaceae bacterium]|nr:hypothetical protein [Acidobacteriaceae bacterium]
MIWLAAVILPILFWQQGADTAPELRKSGVTHIAVPPAAAADWKTTGIVAEPLDLASTIKLPAPGVALRMDEASASHVPWVSSNGWRFLRQPTAKFYYDKPSSPALAAAEAFTFGGQAFIRPAADSAESLTKMLDFLKTINFDHAESINDIRFIDDRSALSGELMNLMVRDNLLFQIVHSRAADSKLTVQLGSKEYPTSTGSDANSLVHRIRTNLTDDKRRIRVFGTSVVIVRVTGGVDQPRVHLLNYGAPAHIRIGAFRIRILGRYSKSQFHCFGTPNAQLMDFNAQSDATEFTVPSLNTYAVVDLAR